MMIALANRIKPVIYVPRERPWPLIGSRELIEVLFEGYSNYLVCWYHWPLDDYIRRDDFEPVILIVHDGRIVDIGIRPHNRYKHSRRFTQKDGRPIIVFRTAWHVAHIFNGEDSLQRYMNSASCELKETYPISLGRPPNYYFRAGARQTVYEYAQELLGYI